jgi:hypothetical protein
MKMAVSVGSSVAAMACIERGNTSQYWHLV